MRKVIAATFISLDGVMQAPGGPDEDRDGGFLYGGWMVNYADEAVSEALGDLFSEPFDLLLGRKTYDIFANHWPFVDDGDPIGELFNDVTKYVATSSEAPLAWKNSVALTGNVWEAVAALKQGDGPTLLLQGSGDFIQTLLAADLIDEFRLMIFPLLLGKGKRLFGEGTLPAALTLTAAKVASTGVAIHTYVRNGEITTGSFELNDEEKARRDAARTTG